MLITGLFGFRFSIEGITFLPYLPADIDYIHISGISYRSCKLDLIVEGMGGRVVECYRNGSKSQPFLPADLQGDQHIQIRVAE